MQAALDSPACDVATIQAAVDLYVDQGRFDRVEPILDRLEHPAMRAAPEVLAWANRTRGLARLSTGRPAEMDRALAAVEQNLKEDPTNPDDLKLKGDHPGCPARPARRRDQAPRAARAIPSARAQRAVRPGPGLPGRRARGPIPRPDGRIAGGRAERMPGILDPLRRFPDRPGGARRRPGTGWPNSSGPRRGRPSLLERQARLLDRRGRKAELLAMLRDRARRAPDEIGADCRPVRAVRIPRGRRGGVQGVRRPAIPASRSGPWPWRGSWPGRIVPAMRSRSSIRPRPACRARGGRAGGAGDSTPHPPPARR